MPDEIPRNSSVFGNISPHVPHQRMLPPHHPEKREKSARPPSRGMLWPISGIVIVLVGLLGWAAISNHSSVNPQIQTTSSIENTPAPTLQQKIQMGNYTGSIENTASNGDIPTNQKATMSFNLESQGTGSLLQGDLTIGDGWHGYLSLFNGKFFASIVADQVQILDAEAPDSTLAAWVKFDGTKNSDGSMGGKFTTSGQQCGNWNLSQSSNVQFTGKMNDTCNGGEASITLTIRSRQDNLSLVSGTMNISDRLYLHYADGTFSLDFIGYTDTHNITLYAIIKEAKGVNIGPEVYTFNGQMNGSLSGTYSDTNNSGDWSANHN